MQRTNSGIQIDLFKSIVDLENQIKSAEDNIEINSCKLSSVATYYEEQMQLKQRQFENDYNEIRSDYNQKIEIDISTLQKFQDNVNKASIAAVVEANEEVLRLEIPKQLLVYQEIIDKELARRKAQFLMEKESEIKEYLTKDENYHSQKREEILANHRRRLED